MLDTISNIPTQFSYPLGVKIRVQDEYQVASILPSSINYKINKIQNLLDEANSSSDNTLFLNFTSGASSGAYPDAVAGRVNGSIRTYINDLKVKKQNRLGIIITDFPDDNGNTSYINDIFNWNFTSPTSFPATDWMRGIPEQTSLSRITIPGTHDTMTWKASAMSKCQNMTLDDQLAAGIRFIDIRCRQYYDEFKLHHGSEFLHMDFNDVLNVCVPFLKRNPSECILMSVKEEYDPDGNNMTFQDVFTNYIEPYSTYWHLGNTMPNLATQETRGKIVLLRRFSITLTSDYAKWGIDMSNWPDNSTFSLPASEKNA